MDVPPVYRDEDLLREEDGRLTGSEPDPREPAVERGRKDRLGGEGGRRGRGERGRVYMADVRPPVALDNANDATRRLPLR